MKNSNKTAIITGISSGIGLALAQKFLSQNYNVIGTTRSGKLDGFTHANLEVIALEATDSLSIEDAISEIQSLATGIDLLINNAGAAPDVFAVIPEVSTFSQTIDTNVTGTVFFTEALLGSLKENGQIIFISSNMALPRNADVNGPGYRMSKAAINMYTTMLAKRLADRKIKVTPVHPGWVKTKLGGDQAPLTPAQSADGIFNGYITGKIENGKFYNITIPGTEEF